MSEITFTVAPELQTRLDKVQEVKDEIAKWRGMPSPEITTKLIMKTTVVYEELMEMCGKYRAMRDELHAHTLKTEKTSSKAEALAKGSEFGKMYSFLEKTTDATNQMIQSLKKVLDYWENTAKNNY